MEQSIFIVRHDFFDNPLAGKEFIKKLVAENCKTEKIALVFDPLAEDFFTHVARSSRDTFEKIVCDFYNEWESDKDVQPLEWYQLDDVATFHITFLSPLVYEMENKFGTYFMGCIPLLHYDPNLYVYFCMNNYDIEDIFLLIDGQRYMKKLESKINEYNAVVNGMKSRKTVKVREELPVQNQVKCGEK